MTPESGPELGPPPAPIVGQCDMREDHPGTAEREPAPLHVDPGQWHTPEDRPMHGVEGRPLATVALPQVELEAADRQSWSNFFLPDLGFWVGFFCWSPCLPPWRSWPPQLRFCLVCRFCGWSFHPPGVASWSWCWSSWSSSGSPWAFVMHHEGALLKRGGSLGGGP